MILTIKELKIRKDLKSLIRRAGNCRLQGRFICRQTRFYMKDYFRSAQTYLLLIILFAGFSLAQVKPKDVAREMDFDEAGAEETLNRELWEAVKKTPYENALRRVERAKQAARSSLSSRATLPNGWQLAPAGEQVEVGRLPMEAVAYNGQIVVLNTGYYNKEPQEVSVVNPDSRQVVKILRVPGLYPSAAVGLDDDLYISGGISQKVFRFDNNYETVREYAARQFTFSFNGRDASSVAQAINRMAGLRLEI